MSTGVLMPRGTTRAHTPVWSRTRKGPVMSPLRELLASLPEGLVVQVLSPSAVLITEADAEEALTKREAAVLRLVAQGLTNGQIARRLEISPRTVEKHVENARGKLGAANRTEAALLAYGMTA